MTSNVKIREQAHATAVRALDRPETEEVERLNLLAHILHPDMGLADRALTVYEQGNPFPTTEREQILTYAVKAIERRVIGAPESRIDLEMFRERDPLAWAAAFARSCIKSGVTVVRRTRRRHPGRSLETAPNTELVTASAEDTYLETLTAAEADALVDTVDRWDRRKMSEHDKATAIARQLRSFYRLPQPFIRTPDTARWIAGALDKNTTEASNLIRFSLEAAAREYSDCEHIDPRLLDLWVDFGIRELRTLQAAPEHVTTAIVAGAASIPEAPGHKHRRSVRNHLRRLDSRAGWHTLVTRLETAWVATYFDARTTKNNKDHRSRQQAEQDRALQAKQWQTVAAEAIDFGGAFKNARTPDNINTHLQQVLKQVRDAE